MKDDGVTLCLSGGGFRATFFHIGVLAALRDTGLLTRVNRLVGVSGGALAAAHAAVHWDDFVGPAARFYEAIGELIAFAQRGPRSRVMRRWVLGAFIGRPFWGAGTRGQLLQSQYRTLFGQRTLSDVSGPALVLTSTSMTTGRVYAFTADGFYVVSDGELSERVQTQSISLAWAITASSCFPPAFPPVPLRRDDLVLSVQQFPLGADFLTDGGVFDNSGLSFIRLAMDSSTKNVIASDASAAFDWSDRNRFWHVISRTARTTDIMMSRIAKFERCAYAEAVGNLVEISIHDDVSVYDPVMHRRVACLRTDLDRFSGTEIRWLLRHGYAAGVTKLVQAFSDCDVPSRRWERCPPPGDDRSEYLATVLNTGSRRRLDLFDVGDWASWCVLAVIVLIILALGYFIP